jgi:small subunit ribosomal protein S21
MPYDAKGKVGATRESSATERDHAQCWRCPVAEVTLQDGETVENALRRFKRKVLQEDIIREVKRHAFYLKPGQKLRVKQALARKRNRKKARRETD